MINRFIKWIGRHFGWIVPSALVSDPDWAEDRFFSAHKAKTERLSAIARERCSLKAMRAIAKKQKKKVSHIDAALRALTNEEIKIELGRS